MEGKEERLLGSVVIRKTLRCGLQVSALSPLGPHPGPSTPSPRVLSNCVFLPGSQFWVTVQRTEAAERCGLHGSYMLRVEAEMLTLLTLGAQGQILEPLLSWPYTLLRRYGRDKVRLPGRASWVGQLQVRWGRTGR
jgi:hypothetical protein